ncbi:HET-domain-containing protein [Hypoxylon rubiginosum]|uniref:HET-domain-containing protein n=1 Tax=Hypoxylon rubiginosum TaxID=110542 RepID=A0ACB9ZFP7_9PEZI|nr:HET-domain-containing protein [Hypoxylon rubiginosum]
MDNVEKGSLINPSWRYLSASSHSRSNVSQYCPRQPYLSLTLPFSNFPASTHIVRRLQLTTFSHDQGRSDSRNSDGTYEGSHTYFNVEVKEPTGHVRIQHDRIVRNIRACIEPRKHIVCWVLDDNNKPPDAVQHDPLYSTDDGNWLSDIRGGDTIQVIPMAEYPGWINFIIEAHIEIWVGTIDTMDLGRTMAQAPAVWPLYQKLDGSQKETRLIIIEPSADRESDIIQLSLTHISLANSDCIRYEALSYCWGDGREQRPILLKGLEPSLPAIQVFISRNLFAALKTLRNEEIGRIFWIDQLCINQSDLEERAEQVALMGDIYAGAKHVRIWLGELDESAGKDFSTIQTISNAYSQANLSRGDVSAHSGGSSDTIPSGAPITPEISHKVIQTAGGINMQNDSVFQRQWFERVWVLQEAWNIPKSCSVLELSQRVTVMCGSAELPWTAILRAGQCLRSYNGSSYNALIPAIWMVLFKHQESSGDLAQDRITFVPQPRLDILTVLINALEMRATDARDKIFALLTFGEETHQVAELPDPIKPDYSKSVQNVYVDFTRWWIQHYHSLGILSAVHTLTGRTWLDGSKCQGFGAGNTETLDVPSWSFWSDGHSQWRRATLGIGDRGTYNASGDIKVNIGTLGLTMPLRPHVLALKGVRIGVLRSTIYYPFYRRPLISEAMHQAYAEIFDPASTIGTWGHGKTQTHLPLMDHGQLPYHYSTHWRDIPRESLDSTSGLTDPDAPDYLPCHGKCMFSTETGVGVGLCPNGSQVGDLVVILFGSKVPHLLRSSNTPGEYYFVGECYMDGVMHGEAFEGNNVLSEETFFLV